MILECIAGTIVMMVMTSEVATLFVYGYDDVFLFPDGRGAKVNKLKLKPRGLFPVSAAANNRSRSQLHEDILDLTRVVAGKGAALT